MRRGFPLIVGALIALLVVPLAWGATPEQIHRDLADGTLDGTYSQADLQRALANPTVSGYDNAGGGRIQQGAVGDEEVGALGALPFTGLDLALLVLGGVVLIALGLVLRRIVAARSVGT
jgi:hypothetical protein